MSAAAYYENPKNLLIKNYQLIYAFNGNYMLQYEYR